MHKHRDWFMVLCWLAAERCLFRRRIANTFIICTNRFDRSEVVYARRSDYQDSGGF
jgi:hypothetical protein